MCVEGQVKATMIAAVQGRRVAQAQAQQQAEITFTESLEVVSPIGSFVAALLVQL